MNLRAAKAVVAGAVAIGAGAAFLGWYPYLFALAWPGLVLARIGVPHAWLFAAALMAGLLIWFGLRSRGRPWWDVIGFSALASGCYCAIAFLYVTRAPVPLPEATPYDSAPAHELAYRQSFDSGYRYGMVGVIRTYCFYPEPETRGFYEGSYSGLEVWNRLFGRRVPDRDRRFIEISAARDGAKVTFTNEEGQPDSAANRSQPIRSETNPTSSAAGSRR